MSLINCLEGLTSKSSDKSQWTSIENSELGTYDSLSTYETWIRTGLDPKVHTEEDIPQSTATQKLLETPNDTNIIGGIKILVFHNWKSTKVANDPKTRVLRSAMRGIGLPLWIPARLFTHAFFCDPANGTMEKTALVRRYWQRFRGGFLLWSYDTSSHGSRAIYLSREDQYWVAFKEGLIRPHKYAMLPMLPGVIGYMEQVRVSVSYIYRVRSQIDKLIKSIDDSLIVVDDDHDSVKSQSMSDDKTWTHEQLKDFEIQTRQLVRSAQEATRAIPYLTDNTGNLSRICNSLTSLRAENEAYHAFWKTTSAEKALQAKELSGLIDDMMVELKSQILAAEWIFTKIDSLIKNTNLTINRADQRSNILIANSSHTIAVESKRDNLSMMTIAAITMVFLPGTFVASLFAMPLLDWTHADSNKIVQSGFWIYWAVTVPLTILTILLWLAWFRRKDIIHWWQEIRHQKGSQRSSSQSSQMNPNQMNGSVIAPLQLRTPVRTKTIDWTDP
jgi:Mg2+ and Co2+ transporter CorA